MAHRRVTELIARYPLRGIKGPVGTAQDMLGLLGGDAGKLAELERRVAEHLGFTEVLTSVGQIYPRSLDQDVLSALVQLAAGPSSLATTIRLMAGQELVTEGFQAGPGRLERHAAQDEHPLLRARQRPRAWCCAATRRWSRSWPAAQWNEGDVSDSVVRRVALPDAFFAIDGLLETILTVLDEFGAYPAVIARELDRYLPFLATTAVLMARGARRGRAARPGTRSSPSTPARWRWTCARRAPRATTCSPGSAATPASGSPPPTSTPPSATRAAFVGAAGAQVAEITRRVGRARGAASRRGGVHARRPIL